MNNVKDMSLDQFRLGNEYQTEEFLGSGSTGAVFKAIDLKNSQTVAIKIIKSEYGKNEKFMSCLNLELKPLLDLHHANIVKINKLGFDENTHYIVMEYVSGKSLDKIMANISQITNSSSTLLDMNYSIYIIKQVAKGLNYAGENKIIHKSLKPEDIIISERNEVKITGFGLSKAIATAWLTMTGTSPTHVEYMSPEQAEGEPADNRCDIYSLGIIAYKLLTGEVPFKKEGSSILSIAMKHINTIPERPSLKNPEIPGWLDNIILKCLEKNPDSRFKSGHELYNALENNGEIGKELIKQIIDSKVINDDDDETDFSIDSDELNKAISQGFTDFSNISEEIRQAQKKREKEKINLEQKNTSSNVHSDNSIFINNSHDNIISKLPEVLDSKLHNLMYESNNEEINITTDEQQYESVNKKELNSEINSPEPRKKHIQLLLIGIIILGIVIISLISYIILHR